MRLGGAALIFGAGKPSPLTSGLPSANSISVFPIRLAFNESRCSDRSLSIDGRGSYIAGNGIGREIALALTDQGLDSLLCTDIDAQGLHETLLQCRKRQNAQGRADPIRAKPVDVRDEESIQRAIDGAIFLGGRVDYFVNAAGGKPRQYHRTELGLVWS